MSLEKNFNLGCPRRRPRRAKNKSISFFPSVGVGVEVGCLITNFGRELMNGAFSHKFALLKWMDGALVH